MSYLDVVGLPLDPARRDDYRAMAETVAAFLKEHGVVSYVDAVADDVPRGQRTDWYRAAATEEGEIVAVSVAIWPDKATRDAAWAAMEADPRFKDMQPEDMPFDGKRMFFGGFTPIVETA